MPPVFFISTEGPGRQPRGAGGSSTGGLRAVLFSLLWVWVLFYVPLKTS